MRAVAIEAYGGVDKLKIMDLPVPEAGHNEVLVRIHAAGVNAVDTFFRDGFLAKNEFPLIMGSDFAGVVEKLGPGVDGYKIGDEVYGYKYGGNGTYAEYAAVPAEFLAKKSQRLSFEEAAAIPCVGLIAYDSLMNTLQIKAGEDVLITGASGGVGTFAVQIAKAAGARVIATAGPHNQDYLRGLGADEVIDYTQGDYVAAVRHLIPNGVDAALSATAATVATIIGAVRDNGRLTWITGPDGPKPERGIQGSFTTGSRGTALLDSLTHLVDEGKLRVIIEKVYSLDRAVQAQEAVVSGHVQGKLVIRIGKELQNVLEK